jgi:hypothetical protein
MAAELAPAVSRHGLENYRTGVYLLAAAASCSTRVTASVRRTCVLTRVPRCKCMVSVMQVCTHMSNCATIGVHITLEAAGLVGVYVTKTWGFLPVLCALVVVSSPLTL